jgi:hypothetical protein
VRRLPAILIRTLLLLWLVPASPASASVPSWLQAREVIADIRIHGNQVSTDADIVKLAGIKIGDAIDAQTVAQITDRLKGAHKFDRVDVLKRFASLTDASQIVIVIIVDEGPVKIELPALPGGVTTMVKRRGLGNIMYLPILDSEDGYGFTYGARFAFPNLTGRRSRLSVPATWGGERQIGIEFEQTFKNPAMSRLQFG